MHLAFETHRNGRYGRARRAWNRRQAPAPALPAYQPCSLRKERVLPGSTTAPDGIFHDRLSEPAARFVLSSRRLQHDPIAVERGELVRGVPDAGKPGLFSRLPLTRIHFGSHHDCADRNWRLSPAYDLTLAPAFSIYLKKRKLLIQKCGEIVGFPPPPPYPVLLP
jgi:hypothetical protein